MSGRPRGEDGWHASVATVALLVLLVGGCAPRRPGSAADLARRERTAEPGPPVVVNLEGTKFTVKDLKGRPVLEADHARVSGGFSPAGDVAPIRMEQGKATLYREGQPYLHLTAPEAVWADGRLRADRTIRLATPDGETVLDGATGEWNAESGEVVVTRGRSETRRRGRVELVAEGERIVYHDAVLTIPNGGRAWQPDDGNEVRAANARFDHRSGVLTAGGGIVFTNRERTAVRAGAVEWFTRANRLRARGGVRMESPDAIASGDRLEANTALKRIRVIGSGRIQLRRLPRPAAQRS